MEKVVEKPADPKTWHSPQWAAAYLYVVKGDQVTKDRVEEMLLYAGNKHPRMELAKVIMNDLTPYQTMSATEIYWLFHTYEKKIRDELHALFAKRAVENRVTPADVCALASQLGYVLQAHAVQEVLVEAIGRSGSNPAARINVEGFTRFMDLIYQREGFSKTELMAMEEAYQRFDYNASSILEANEVPAVIAWLSFVLDPVCVRRLVANFTSEDGGLNWNQFVMLNRESRMLEHQQSKTLFDKFDSDKDGIIGPVEVLVLFRALGVTVLPEALLEAVEDSRMDGMKFAFDDYLRVLQVLRDREGFTSAEANEIGEAFRKFDSFERNALSTRQAFRALRWLGFLLHPKDLGRVDWKYEADEFGVLLRPEFMRLVRRHFEATVISIRQIFREFSDQGGAKPMHKSKLRSALKRLDHGYLDDYLGWLHHNLPARWLFQKNASLDFEDFRRLVQGCRDKVCDRVRAQHGYIDVEIARLRILFVQHAEDGASGRVPPAGLIELFRQLHPSIQSSSEARNRLKKALEVNKCAGAGINWLLFLQVMRTHQTLLESDEESQAPLVMATLFLRRSRVDDFFDAFHRFVREGPGELNRQQITMIMGRDQLTDEQLEEAIEALEELREMNAGAVGVPQLLAVVKELRNDARPSSGTSGANMGTESACPPGTESMALGDVRKRPSRSAPDRRSSKEKGSPMRGAH